MYRSFDDTNHPNMKSNLVIYAGGWAGPGCTVLYCVCVCVGVVFHGKIKHISLSTKAYHVFMYLMCVCVCAIISAPLPRMYRVPQNRKYKYMYRNNNNNNTENVEEDANNNTFKNIAKCTHDDDTVCTFGVESTIQFHQYTHVHVCAMHTTPYCLLFIYIIVLFIIFMRYWSSRWKQTHEITYNFSAIKVYPLDDDKTKNNTEFCVQLVLSLLIVFHSVLFAFWNRKICNFTRSIREYLFFSFSLVCVLYADNDEKPYDCLLQIVISFLNIIHFSFHSYCDCVLLGGVECIVYRYGMVLFALFRLSSQKSTSINTKKSNNLPMYTL